jgi:hypothetical protein
MEDPANGEEKSRQHKCCCTERLTNKKWFEACTSGSYGCCWRQHGYEILEKSPQKQHEVNMTIQAVITLWELHTKTQTINSSDELPWLPCQVMQLMRTTRPNRSLEVTGVGIFFCNTYMSSHSSKWDSLLDQKSSSDLCLQCTGIAKFPFSKWVQLVTSDPDVCLP